MFYDNFIRLCAERKESPSGVAKKIGLSNAAANGWKNGKQPSDVTIEKLSQFFGVPVFELTGVDTEKLTLDEAKRKLSLMVEENPSMPSGKRLDFLFDENDYEPMIVAHNLDIDQAYIDNWAKHGILPPQPIVDKILGVFQMKVGELLNDEELAAYEEENEECGKAPSDSQNKKSHPRFREWAAGEYHNACESQWAIYRENTI